MLAREDLGIGNRSVMTPGGGGGTSALNCLRFPPPAVIVCDALGASAIAQPNRYVIFSAPRSCSTTTIRGFLKNTELHRANALRISSKSQANRLAKRLFIRFSKKENPRVNEGCCRVR